MKPYLDDGDVVLYAGDCLEVMAELPAESVDAVVTDPPYGIGFMGREWDHLPPGRPWAEACLRVLKPGGHLLAFGGTRTSHRLACAIEDAGFEIRDALVWLYGSGFPKSLDVSKAIDRAAGAEREVVGPGINHAAKVKHGGTWTGGVYAQDDYTGAEGPMVTAPATPAAAQWQGWGTALKPGHEPIVVARNPLAERTVAAQVLATGTGAINVDGCRGDPAGRWPANVVLDEQAAALLDAEVGERPSGSRKAGDYGRLGGHGRYSAWDAGPMPAIEGDTGGPSRFFYCAKASTAERRGSKHPTVKPIALMRWLVRLVTPPGGTVLDPFAGTGTTLAAAREEGFRAVGIEREAEYLADAARRLARTPATLFGQAASS